MLHILVSALQVWSFEQLNDKSHRMLHAMTAEQLQNNVLTLQLGTGAAHGLCCSSPA